MFRITRVWMNAHSRTGSAGWNAKQLEVLGISWPPSKGWLDSVIGSELTEDEKKRFESFAGKSQEGVKIDRGKANMATNPVYHSWPDGKGGWYGEWMSDARPPWDTTNSSKGRQHSPKVRS